MDIDLNLLRTFDVLMELRSVTRAAVRLGVSQSAVSQALGRLRATFDDPLFTRTPRGLQPTARSALLAPVVHEALDRILAALEPKTFDEARSDRQFTIAAGGYFCALVAPAFLELARRVAPTVTFRIVPVGELLIEGLDYGTVDLALGAFPSPPPRFAVEHLFDETMVWIASTANPLAAVPFDARRVAAAPRVRITIAFGAPEYLAEHNRIYFTGEAEPQERTVYDAQTAIAVVAGSDLVALAPRRLAQHHARSVAILGPETAGRILSLGMLWHSRQSADPGMTWLRRLLVEVFNATS